MAALKQILKGKKAKLEVNLDELLDVVVPNNSQFRQAIGQDIIDTIRKRTADNKFLKTSGRWFEYSQEYADSIEFKAYGKSKGNVNLKQTGEMLGFMDIIEEKKNAIVIGWEDENAKKAHGHITGNVGKTRDFLGLTESEISSLRKKWQPIAEEATGVAGAALSSVEATREFVAGERSISKFQTLGSIIQGLFNDGEG